VLTTPQYPDNTDSAARRRYSCDVRKTLRATEATCSATSKAIAAAIIRGHARVGRLHATRHSWHLTKPTETLLVYFFYFVYDVISAYSTYESFNILLRSLFSRVLC